MRKINKIICVMLTIFILLPVLLQSFESARASSPVFEFHHQTLSSYIDRYGITTSAEWGNSGVFFAGQFDFDGDGTPELVIAYNDGNSTIYPRVGFDIAVYDQTQRLNDPTDPMTGRWTQIDSIVVSRSGRAYINYEGGASGAWGSYGCNGYVSLRNGIWFSALEAFTEFDYVGDDDFIISYNYFENGAEISETEYNTAKTRLDIVEVIDIYNCDVNAVLARLKAGDTPAESGITIDYGEVSRFRTPREYIDYLRAAIQNTGGTALSAHALREIAAYIQNAISSQAVTTFRARGNQIRIAGADIERAAGNAVQSYNGLMAVLSENDIVLGRPVTIIIRAEGQNLSISDGLQATFDKSLTDTLGNSSVMLTLGDNRHALTVSGADLREITSQYGVLVVQIERVRDGVYNIVFIDSNSNIIDRLPTPITVTLPAAGMFDTVFASFHGGTDNWGGQYDDLVGTIQFSTPFTGVYEVMENVLEIPDIDHMNDEMQSAIRFMVSKGFFELTNGNFDPGGKLTRYEFASTLVRLFFALDRDLTTSFEDVPLSSGYYSYIASGEHEGIIEGIGQNLFAGERIMTREEAVVVAVRTLTNKRDYSVPANPYAHLSLLSDSNEISGWARDLIALAVREGIASGSGGAFFPGRDITRVEAAVILYRLFMLLYETPPVVIIMQPETDEPAPDDPGQAESGERSRDPESTGDESDSLLSLILIGVGGAGVLGCGGYLVYYFSKKPQRR